MRLVSLAVALLLTVPAAAQSVQKDASAPASGAAASRAAVDPSGTYDWSLEAGGQTYTGSLVVSKTNDTTYAATVVHAQNMGEVKAKSVKLTGDHLVIVSDTPYGDLTMDVKVGEKPEAAWSVGDGSNSGAMTIVRRKS